MSKFNIPLFLKWVGGKSSLIPQYDSLGLFPSKIDRYIEPFLGGGSMFFYIKQNYNPKEMFVSDRNKELILTYESIQQEPKKLIELLKEHKSNHSEQYYYYIRDKDIDFTVMPKIEIAARFIYLNKTCFNGMYRVNSKGKNNVSFGDYKNPEIYDEGVIIESSKILQGVNISVKTYEEILDIAKSKDFVYFDPPYYPVSDTSSFATYTDIGFLADDHRRLANIYTELDKRGCLLMLSNSYCELVLELYQRFNIEIVHTRRMISGDTKGRNIVSEVVVTNYEKKCEQKSLFEF